MGGISPITTLVHDRICGIRLQHDCGRVLNILSVYLPAPGSSEELSTVLDELTNLIENLEEKSFTLICGDFNGDVGYRGGPRENRKPTNAGKKVMEFFNEFSLEPCNLSHFAKGPVNTFCVAMGASTIDYVAVPKGLIQDVVSCEVLEDPILNTSEHNVVQVVMHTDGLKVGYSNPDRPTNVKWCKLNKVVLENNYTTPANEFCENLIANTDFERLTPQGIDEIIELITDKLVKLDKNLPRTKHKKTCEAVLDY